MITVWISLHLFLFMNRLICLRHQMTLRDSMSFQLGHRASSHFLIALRRMMTLYRVALSKSPLDRWDHESWINPRNFPIIALPWIPVLQIFTVWVRYRVALKAISLKFQITKIWNRIVTKFTRPSSQNVPSTSHRLWRHLSSSLLLRKVFHWRINIWIQWSWMTFGELLVGEKSVKTIETSNDSTHNSIALRPSPLPIIPNQTPKPVQRKKSNLKLPIPLRRLISKKVTTNRRLQGVQTVDLSRLLPLLIRQPVFMFVLLEIVPSKHPILRPSQSIFPHRWSDEVAFPVDVPTQPVGVVRWVQLFVIVVGLGMQTWDKALISRYKKCGIICADKKCRYIPTRSEIHELKRQGVRGRGRCYACRGDVIIREKEWDVMARYILFACIFIPFFRFENYFAVGKLLRIDIRGYCDWLFGRYIILSLALCYNIWYCWNYWKTWNYIWGIRKYAENN